MSALASGHRADSGHGLRGRLAGRICASHALSGSGLREEEDRRCAEGGPLGGRRGRSPQKAPFGKTAWCRTERVHQVDH